MFLVPMAVLEYIVGSTKANSVLQASENSFESRGLGKEGRGGEKKKRNLCPRLIPRS